MAKMKRASTVPKLARAAGIESDPRRARTDTTSAERTKAAAERTKAALVEAWIGGGQAGAAIPKH